VVVTEPSDLIQEHDAVRMGLDGASGPIYHCRRAVAGIPQQ